jgi:NAD(P)-dependent dehydrogenase (short-subunit alcohol dehydrogenase family)
MKTTGRLICYAGVKKQQKSMANYFIVGASSGIGKKLAEHLAEDGHQVWGTYHTHQLNPDNPLIQYYPLNVLDEQPDLHFIPETLNGLVYCPGSIHLRPFERIKPLEFIQDYNLQVVGAIKVIQSVLPKLKAANNAAIVLFSTVAVETGFMYHAQVSASKGAIEGLTRALAAEFAPKIRVNCIAPSLTDTPLSATLLNTEQKRDAHAQRHPMKRIGTIDDFVHMTAFLLSSKASWMTGQVLHVDGGISTIKTS